MSREELRREKHSTQTESGDTVEWELITYRSADDGLTISYEINYEGYTTPVLFNGKDTDYLYDAITFIEMVDAGLMK